MRIDGAEWFMVVCCVISLGFLIYIVNGACN